MEEWKMQIRQLREQINKIKSERKSEIEEARKRKEEIIKQKKLMKEKIESGANFVIDNLRNRNYSDNEILKVIGRVKMKILKQNQNI